MEADKFSSHRVNFETATLWLFVSEVQLEIAFASPCLAFALPGFLSTCLGLL